MAHSANESRIGSERLPERPERYRTGLVNSQRSLSDFPGYTIGKAYAVLTESRNSCVNGLAKMELEAMPSPSFGIASLTCGVTICASSAALSTQISQVRKRPGDFCTSSSVI
jgi:hypothetical protein